METVNVVKRAALDRHLDQLEAEKGTCRVEVHIKNGVIVSGNLYLPILN